MGTLQLSQRLVPTSRPVHTEVMGDSANCLADPSETTFHQQAK